jgi:hypothetical protein
MPPLLWGVNEGMTRPSFLAFLMRLLLGWALWMPLWAQADQSVWALAGDDEGIAIYTRKLPGNPYKDFKAQMQVDVPMKQVVATLADVNNMREWFFLLRESRFIPGKVAGESYLYMAMSGIWPVSARDVVAHVAIRQDPDTHAIHVDVDSRDGIAPPQAGYVRMPRLRFSWTLRHISATKTAVELEGHGNPGGMVPISLANVVITTLPRQSLDRMRTYMMRTNYTDTEQMYARNPPLRDLGKRLFFPPS